MLAHSSGELLLLGTEGGHVFVVEVPGFRELEERNISLDQVANRSVQWESVFVYVYTHRMISTDLTGYMSVGSHFTLLCKHPGGNIRHFDSFI